jgi:hypothetical protein
LSSSIVSTLGRMEDFSLALGSANKPQQLRITIKRQKPKSINAQPLKGKLLSMSYIPLQIVTYSRLPTDPITPNMELHIPRMSIGKNF